MATVLAYKLTKGIIGARRSKTIDWLCLDGKSQVTIEYKDDKPYRDGYGNSVRLTQIKCRY